MLIVNNLLGGVVPLRLALYVPRGSLRPASRTWPYSLTLHRFLHVSFVAAQIAATFIAMAENFFLNNLVTFRDRPLRGLRMLSGATRFVAACGFGAWANVIFARTLVEAGTPWLVAGLAGIILGSVWNLSISSLFTWRMRPRQERHAVAAEAFAPDVEVLR